jgi:hypothetical protein
MPILAELGAIAVKGAAMESLAKAFDRRLRHQLQVAQRLQL